MSYAAQLAALSDSILNGSDAALPYIRPAARLAVYTEGYRARMFQAVREDYLALAQYVGEEQLALAIRAYIRATPSHDWDLNRYPIGFGQFFAAQTEDQAARSIALRESAVAEVFLLPDSEALSPSALASLSEEQLAQRHFGPRVALRLLAEPLCVVRHGNEVRRVKLEAAEYALLLALFGGASFGEALDRVKPHADDLPAYLARWLEHGFFTA